jgi:predicted DNA-binding protein
MDTKKVDNKRMVAARFAPEMIARLDRASKITGLKKTTIIEQGTSKRLVEIEKIVLDLG